MPAAAVVGVFAIVKLHRVADVHGQSLRFRIEGAEFFLLLVGVDFGGLDLVAQGVEFGEQRAHFRGAGHGHWDVGAGRGGGGAGVPDAGVVPQPAVVPGFAVGFGGGAGGFAVDDLFRRFRDGVVAGQIGDGGGGDVPAIVAPRPGGEDAPAHAKIEHLVEMGAVHGQPRRRLGEDAGQRRLRGQRQIHVAGFLEQPVEETAGHAVVQLDPVVGAQRPVGSRGVFICIARGFQRADDGGHGVWQATVWHSSLRCWLFDRNCCK